MNFGGEKLQISKSIPALYKHALTYVVSDRMPERHL